MRNDRGIVTQLHSHTQHRMDTQQPGPLYHKFRKRSTDNSSETLSWTVIRIDYLRYIGVAAPTPDTFNNCKARITRVFTVTSDSLCFQVLSERGSWKDPLQVVSLRSLPTIGRNNQLLYPASGGTRTSTCLSANHKWVRMKLCSQSDMDEVGCRPVGCRSAGLWEGSGSAYGGKKTEQVWTFYPVWTIGNLSGATDSILGLFPCKRA